MRRRVAAGHGVLFGGFDVIAPALGEEVSGRQSVGGVLIAVTALGSALGGVWWGMRSSGVPARGYVRAPGSCRWAWRCSRCRTGWPR